MIGGTAQADVGVLVIAARKVRGQDSGLKLGSGLRIRLG